MTSPRSILIAAALLLGACGCGATTLAPVKGTVTYRGQPVADGTISFLPEKGRPANGLIKDGAIVEVTTYDRNDGAPIGPSRVVIAAVSNPHDMYAEHKSLLPAKYGDPAQSDLTADVKSGGTELTFDLK